MTKAETPDPNAIPEPVEGKTVFQIGKNVRLRFNADGWVEEVGRGDGILGTVLQGHSSSGTDDILARRYYDMYTRVVILDIHPKRATDFTGASGVVKFSDLEPGSQMHERVSQIIRIGNHHFSLGIAPLKN